ncbi:YbjN domain-containing protein [Arcanobacterium hippocoleae]
MNDLEFSNASGDKPDSGNSAAPQQKENSSGRGKNNLKYGEITAPVSIERICAIFDAAGWKYNLADSELQSGFGGKPFIITYNTESNCLDLTSLLISGVSEIPENDVLGFIEEWHHTKILPKAYLFRTEDGEALIRLEHMLLFADAEERIFGATDAQLAGYLEQFIFSALAFFEEFNNFFGKGEI